MIMLPQATHTESVDSSLSIQAPTSGNWKLLGSFWLKFQYTHEKKVKPQDLLFTNPRCGGAINWGKGSLLSWVMTTGDRDQGSTYLSNHLCSWTEVTNFLKAQLQVAILKGALGKNKMGTWGRNAKFSSESKRPDSECEQGYHTIKCLGSDSKYLFPHYALLTCQAAGKADCRVHRESSKNMGAGS